MMDFKAHVTTALDRLANVTAQWTVAGGATQDVKGLFTDPSENIAMGNIDVMAAQPYLRASTGAIPAGAANGDQVVINGTTYKADAMDAHKTAGITRIALINLG